MREEALVDREDALGLDGSEETIEGAAVKIAGLVVHACHDRVRRVHEDANDDAGTCRAEDVERHAVFHVEGGLDASLGEEVGRQLNRRAERRPHHSGYDATIKTSGAFGCVYLPQAVPCITVLMLRADW